MMLSFNWVYYTDLFEMLILGVLCPSAGKAKEEKQIMNGTVEKKVEKYLPASDKIRTLPTKGDTQRQEDSAPALDSKLLSVDGKSDSVRRAHSWGKCDEERPELHKRVSSSLDDLSKEVNGEENKTVKARGKLDVVKNKRPVSLNLETLESPKEEANRLADILDSIKKASDKTKSTSNVSLASLNDVDVNLNNQENALLNPNRSNLHTKSYSYSCLADLKLGDDGNPVDEQKTG